jgi:hypothetical protein
MRLNPFSRPKPPEPRIDKSKIGNPTDLRKMGPQEPVRQESAGPGKAGVGIQTGQQFPRFQQGGQMEFLAGRTPGEAGAPITGKMMQGPQNLPQLDKAVQAKPDVLGQAHGVPTRDSMPWQTDKLPDIGLAENMPKFPGTRERGAGASGLPEGWTSTPFQWPLNNGSQTSLGGNVGHE